MSTPICVHLNFLKLFQTKDILFPLYLRFLKKDKKQKRRKEPHNKKKKKGRNSFRNMAEETRHYDNF